MRKITADRIYPVSGPPVENGLIVLDEAGKILELTVQNTYATGDVERYQGVLVPGFINAHCHLELSHMQSRVDTGTGLIPFITTIVQQRDADLVQIQNAIVSAEQEMIRNGIVAVGDISNATTSFTCKEKNNLRYYTFIEMFDFLQEEQADRAFGQYKTVYDALRLPPGHRKSCVPHSPYSVSSRLHNLISTWNRGQEVSVSTHNQEMPDENTLFLDKSGGLPAFYETFGVSLDQFTATGKTSIYSLFDHLDPAQRNLLVHNILTTRQEICDAQAWSNRIYWITCPNANLYIENRLPDYRIFLDTGAKMAIGTDSLASNWQLSILAEMQTISKYQSCIAFEDLLRWATLHGAEALGFDADLGSLDRGKAPGVLLINFGPEERHLHEDHVVRKVA